MSSPAIETPEQLERWRTLEPAINAQVLGQNDAVARVVTAILAGEMGHASPGRPKSFAILLGPTGTGKTATLLAASKHLFGNSAIMRLNMAEYPEKRDLERVIGGAGERGNFGKLFDEMKAAGGRIILLDEIEKAHKDISNVFLGMEAAELRLGDGSQLDLQDYHIICTSNLGSEDAMEMQGLPYTIIAEHIEQEAMRHFRPEVWGRFTHKVVYRHLPYEVQINICRLMLGEELQLQAGRLRRELSAVDGVFRFLVARGFHETLGARPMRNAVEYYVRRAIVMARLQGLPAGRLQVALRGESLVVVPFVPPSESSETQAAA